MKRLLAGLVFFLLFSLAWSVWGEKFGGSFSTDYMTQDSPKNLKTTISTPQPIAPAPDSTLSTSAKSEPALTTAQPPVDPLTSQQQTIMISPMPAQQQAAPELSTPAIGTTTLKSPYQVKMPRVTVPDYEKRFQESLQAEHRARIAKKRQSLIDAILEEASKYGLFFVLGFVILVMLYAMRKEGKQPLPPEREGLDDERKDIWHEEF